MSSSLLVCGTIFGQLALYNITTRNADIRKISPRSECLIVSVCPLSLLDLRSAYHDSSLSSHPPLNAVAACVENNIVVCMISEEEGIHERCELVGHMARVNAVLAVEPGIIVSASDDATLRVWEVNTATCTRVLTAHKGSVSSLARQTLKPRLARCALLLRSLTSPATTPLI